MLSRFDTIPERDKRMYRQVNGQNCYNNIVKKKVKGKVTCIYIALIFVVHARRSGTDHTVLPAITPMPACTSCSPDGASLD